MDYKKIIKSQSMRFAILHAFEWVPDSIMLRIQYRIKCGRWPNFKNPTRFTEKLQLYKMKYRNPVMHQCVDKYEVRRYVERKGLGHILNELYGIYDAPEQIDFKLLPKQFVIKSTSGGGGNNVIVVKDKSACDVVKMKSTVSLWMKDQSGQINAGREWAYTGIKKTRIIAEKYLEDYSGGGLTDYKFFCFNGEPRYMYVIPNRSMGEYATLGVYDMQFNKLPVYRCDEHRLESAISKPDHFEEMIDVARKLSADFPHVRVDLYNIGGRIYFGELTFYDGSGYYNYEPDGFDMQMGGCFTEY